MHRFKNRTPGSKLIAECIANDYDQINARKFKDTLASKSQELTNVEL